MTDNQLPTVEDNFRKELIGLGDYFGAYFDTLTFCETVNPDESYTTGIDEAVQTVKYGVWHCMEGIAPEFGIDEPDCKLSYPVVLTYALFHLGTLVDDNPEFMAAVHRRLVEDGWIGSAVLPEHFIDPLL